MATETTHDWEGTMSGGKICRNCSTIYDPKNTLPNEACSINQSEGRKSVTTPDERIDRIMTRIYRRFKDWSKREFSADDVTWCEVRADIMEIINGTI